MAAQGREVTLHCGAFLRQADRARRGGCACLFFAALALSCDRVDTALSRRLEQAELERDRLRQELVTRAAENAAHERYIAATTKELNEVQDSIDGVRRDLGVIHVSMSQSGEFGGSREHQGQAVLSDIANIRSAVQANMERLARIESRYQGSAAEVSLLKSIVKQLQDHVADQQREIAEMTERIRQLKEELAHREERIRRDEQALESNARSIEQMKEEARTGYVLVGSVTELRSLNLIEGQRTGFFGLHRQWRLKNTSDKRGFSPIDTAQVTEIPIAAPLAAVEILTSHPPSSYRLERDVAGHTVLRISDPDRFWQFRYLVILIRP